MDLEITPEALAQLEELKKTDPTVADKVRDFIAKARQAADGLETGKYESFEQGMEALTGVKPEPVDALLYEELRKMRRASEQDQEDYSKEDKAKWRKEFLELKSKTVLDEIFGKILESFAPKDYPGIVSVFFGSTYLLFSKITLAYAGSESMDEFCEFMVKIDEELETMKSVILGIAEERIKEQKSS